MMSPQTWTKSLLVRAFSRLSGRPAVELSRPARRAGTRGRRVRTPRQSVMAEQYSVAIERLETRVLLAGTPVLTYHNDLQSTGVNATETLLTHASVNTATFGKQFATQVDGQVYAQPLYVPGLNFTSGTQAGVHNTVLVATEHNTIYWIDANGGNVIWTLSLNDINNPFVNRINATSITSVPSGETGSGDMVPETGTTATPTIDLATKMMYVESKSKQIVGGNLNAPHYVHTIYKINIETGAIAASRNYSDTIYSGGNYTYRTTETGTGVDPYVVGTGDGAINVGGESRVYFNGLRQMNRPGLVLYNGQIISASASHGDNGPYHGWVLAFDANTLATTAAFNTTPNGGLGGIWQSGGIPAIDSQGFIYFETGNGTFDSNNGVAMTAQGFQGRANYGDCFLKLAFDPTSTQANQNGNPNGWGLKLVDYFSPFNNQQLDSADVDLGSGGVTVLPDSAGSAAHPRLLVGSGKEGKIYLIDRDNMGKFNPNTDNVVQTVGGGINGSLNTPAFFNGRLYYFPGYSGNGRSFALSDGQIGSYQQTSDTIGYLNGTPSISANGVANGIVWVIDRGSNQLKAYNADNLTQQLWTSGQAANNRDQLGPVVKFTVPTVADGQVFVGTSNQLVVYGPPVAPTSSPAAPSGLTLSAPAFNRVVLNWVDQSSNEDSFLIERSTGGGAWTQIATVSANATSYADTTVLATTSYSYRIRSHNTFNTDSYSSYVTAGPVTTPQAPPTGTGDGLAVSYFIDGFRHLAGNPVLTRVDASADFDWGNGSPGAGVPTDGFSARWVGTKTPTATGNYTFHTISDDGIRLWVNDQLVIDNWTDHPPTDNYGTISLTAGTAASIRLEYFESGGGAVARLRWSGPGLAETPLMFDAPGATASFYVDGGGGHLQAPASVIRVEPTIDSTVNWDNNGAPAPTVGSTNFSASWTGRVQAQYSETYTFRTYSDDGVRLWVNGQLLIDNWTNHGPTSDFGSILLSAGQKYDIRMDFFQGGGPATAQLFWSSPSTTEVLIPQTQLYSGVAPAAPTNLAVVAASGTQLNLSWTNNTNIATGYAVERATNGVNFTVVTAALPPFTTSYQDTSLNPNVTYTYRVRALNFAANSTYSNVVSLTTPIPPDRPTNARPTAVTTTSIALAWNDNANNEDGYRVSRSINNGSFIVIATLPPDTTTLLDTSPMLVPGATVEYHIQAFNVAGFNDFTGFNTDTLSLPPSSPTATAGSTGITVGWTRPTGFAPLSFNVYRGSTSGGQSTTPLVTGLGDTVTSFIDTTATPGLQYFYRVTAVDDGGESAPSAEISATAISGGVTINGTAGNDALILNLQTNGTITGTLNGSAITTIPAQTAVSLNLLGGVNTVTINGTSGDDQFDQLNGQLVWRGTAINLVGSAQVTVNGQNGSDTFSIAGNAAAFSFAGGDGNDQFLLAPTAAAVAIDGGLANDTIDYRSWVNAVSVNLSIGAATGVSTLANVENVAGGAGNDTLTGNTADNVLTGNGGNDSLSGGTGNDTYVFVANTPLGSDAIYEVGGVDTVSFAGTTSAIVFSLGLTAPQVVNSNLTLRLGNTVPQVENLTGGNGDDTLTGNTQNNVLTGGPGNDSLAGLSGSDTYAFNPSVPQGSDTITDTAGGSDLLDLSASTIAVSVNLGQTTSQGVNPNLTLTLADASPSIENVTTGSGDDLLMGNGLNNLLNGGAGNDRYLLSTAVPLGVETLSDPSGTDTLDFTGSMSGLNVNLGLTAQQTVGANLRLVLASSSAFENVIGGNGNDRFIGNSSSNVFNGGPGNDTYVFTADSPQGTDTILEAGGLDTVTFAGTTAGVALDLGVTAPQIVNSNLTLVLPQLTPQIENLIGGSGNDTLTGNSLNNSLTGGPGNDTLAGGNGSDTYVFADAAAAETDTVIELVGGGSNDRLDFSATTTGVVANLTLDATLATMTNRGVKTGAAGQAAYFEQVIGGSGNDTLTGNAANNLLVGGAGNDTVSGGTGRDLLVGGTGADTLLGGSNSDILIAGQPSNLSNDALTVILGRWGLSGPYAGRVSSVTTGSPSLTSFTLLNDSANDSLDGGLGTGDADLDLFFTSVGDTFASPTEPGEQIIAI